MTQKTTRTALILATFALVSVMTSGAVVPAAFAQTVDPFTAEGGLLDQFLADDGGTDSNTGGGSITDGTERTEETQTQASTQDETNTQSNSLDQDQTGAINEEIASGEDSEAASAANSDSASASESTYETKYKSKHGGSGSSYPGTSDSDSTSTSDSISDVPNTGTLGQNQELSTPTQVNTNNGGNDQSRSATVGFDLGFEQFTQQESAVPGIGTSAPIVIPQ